MEKIALKICPRCQHQAPLGASVCGHCGHHYPTIAGMAPIIARKSAPVNTKALRGLWLWLIPLALFGAWQLAARHQSGSATLNIGGLWGKPREVVLGRLSPFPIAGSSESNGPLLVKPVLAPDAVDLDWETVRLPRGTTVSVIFSQSGLDSVIVRHIRVAGSSLDHPEPVFRHFSMTVDSPPDQRLPMMAQWNHWNGCRLRLLTKVVGGPVTAMKIDALDGIKVKSDSLAVP